MAKRKPQPAPTPARDDVMVIAVAGFKHDGAYVRTGDTITMPRRDALDLRALNMVRILEAPAAV